MSTQKEEMDTWILSTELSFKNRMMELSRKRGEFYQRIQGSGDSWTVLIMSATILGTKPMIYYLQDEREQAGSGYISPLCSKYQEFSRSLVTFGAPLGWPTINEILLLRLDYLVPSLIQAGAPVNPKSDIFPFSTLDLAIRLGRCGTMIALTKAGTNMDIVNISSPTYCNLAWKLVWDHIMMKTFRQVNLEHFARRSIRQHLCTIHQNPEQGINHLLEQLPLPKSLQKYLKFEEDFNDLNYLDYF